MKKRIAILLGVFVVGSWSFAAQAKETAYYLGVLSDKYPPALVTVELMDAQAEIVEIGGGLLLFGVGAQTHLTPFLRDLLFLEAIYDDPAGALADQSVCELPITKRFVQLRSLPRGESNSIRADIRPFFDQFVKRNDTKLLNPNNGIDAEVTGIDAILDTGGIIAGRVTNSSGSPVSAMVRVYDATVQYTSSTYLKYVATDISGDYSIKGLRSGTYKVYFIPGTGNYLPEWYDDRSTFATAGPINVAAGSTRDNINAVLGPGAIISGRVTDGVGVGLAGVQIQVLDASQQYYSSYSAIKSATTDALGDYTIQGLPTGTYKAYFLPPLSTNFRPEWYDDKNSIASASSIGATAGAQTSNINAALSPGGIITGRVTSNAGAGIQSVGVSAYDATQSSSSSVVRNSVTDANGNYSVQGLSSGSYKVYFAPAAGNYLPEWYDGKGSFEAAKTVAVAVGATTEKIDAILDPGGIVSGRVTDKSGKEIQGLHVRLYDASRSYSTIYSYIESVYTDSSGRYSFEGLPTGIYKVFFQPVLTDHMPEWYNDKKSYSSANQISVTAGSTTPDINAALGPGNAISGRVTNTSGAPISYCYVYAYYVNGYFASLDSTDTDGKYRIVGLIDGCYKIEFRPSSPDNYAPEWYNNKPGEGTADVIGLGTYLELTSPNQFEEWTSGSTYNISWVSGGLTGNVAIELYRNDVFAANIGSADINAGKFPWTIPTTLPDGFGYKIRVHQGAYEDYSDWPFTIRGLTGKIIIVTQPNGGEKWRAGTSQKITWIQSGLTGDVTIQLYKGGTFTNIIGSAAASSGTFSWAIPTSQSSGSDYGIRIYQGSAEDYSDASFSILTVGKDDFLGSWSGQGVYSRNSDTGEWTYLASAATRLASGDLDGDGKDELIGNWSDSGIWVKYSSSGQWTQLSSPAEWIAGGDLNGDGKEDLIGIWSTTIWVRDSASGNWSSITGGATQIAAGDVNGDGKGDLIANWPDSGVWMRYSGSSQWIALSSSPASWISAGDIDGDGKAELVGLWGTTIWTFNPTSGEWSLVSSGAAQVTTGDLDGDGKADVIGVWPGSGAWVKYSASGNWERLSSVPEWIAAARLR